MKGSPVLLSIFSWRKNKVPHPLFRSVFRGFKLPPCDPSPFPFFRLFWCKSSLSFANPSTLMNKHRSVCGAPYTLETMFSFKVFRIAWSGFVNDISGTALSGLGARQWRISYIISHKELRLQLYKQHRKWSFFLSVMFRLLKLCKPGKYNNRFVKTPKCLTIHFPSKEPAVRLMLRIVNPKCGELIK